MQAFLTISPDMQTFRLGKMPSESRPLCMHACQVALPKALSLCLAISRYVLKYQRRLYYSIRVPIVELLMAS